MSTGPFQNMRLACIFAALFCAFPVWGSQMGILEPDPDQALDVNGKIEIGDDARAPTNGTLRYNDDVDDFEGYAGGEWHSLTQSAVAGSPQPVVFAEFGLPNTNTWTDFDRSYDYTLFDPTTDLTNVVVPVGKIFVVEQICATLSSGTNGDDYFYASVRPTEMLGNGDQTNRNPQIVISGGRRDGTTCIQGNRAPLLVVKNQGSIKAWNSSNSGGQLRILVYGFYVDQLEDYFSY